jgi:hypothetical protein
VNWALLFLFLTFLVQDDLPLHRLSKRLHFPDTINFGMQSNGALDLVSTSQRVVRNSDDKEIRENVFSSSKLCSLYDKVLEVLLLQCCCFKLQQASCCRPLLF